jgi:hypothetical protein
MSYDIYALQVPPGEANADTLDAILARETATDRMTPLDPAKEARKRSIASALATSGRGYEIVEHKYEDVAETHEMSEEEARRLLRHVQCDNGTVLVEVEDQHAAVRVPLAGSLVGDEIADDVFGALRVLRDEAHLTPYDPQLERELDLEADADRAAFLDAFARAVEEAKSKGVEERVEDRPRSPWWKRLIGADD